MKSWASQVSSCRSGAGRLWVQGPSCWLARDSPIPGATARGRLATAPMRKQAIREVAAVALMRLRRTSCCGVEGGTDRDACQRTVAAGANRVQQVPLLLLLLWPHLAECKAWVSEAAARLSSLGTLQEATARKTRWCQGGGDVPAACRSCLQRSYCAVGIRALRAASTHAHDSDGGGQRSVGSWLVRAGAGRGGCTSAADGGAQLCISPCHQCLRGCQS